MLKNAYQSPRNLTTEREEHFAISSAHGQYKRLLLIAAGAVSLALAASPWLALLLLRDGLLLLEHLFRTDEMDAPDNWAMALQRAIYFSQFFAVLGCALMFGLWWSGWRRRAD